MGKASLQSSTLEGLNVSGKAIQPHSGLIYCLTNSTGSTRGFYESCQVGRFIFLLFLFTEISFCRVAALASERSVSLLVVVCGKALALPKCSV